MGFLDEQKEALKEKAKKEAKKKIIKVIVTKVLPPALGILIVAVIFFAITNAMAEKMRDLINVATTFKTNILNFLFDDNWIDLTNEIEVEYTTNSGETYTEKRTLVDQYIYRLDELGISLKDLRILGDADYTIEDIMGNPENKAKVEKYIKAFVVADLITGQIHRRDGASLVKVEENSPVMKAIFGSVLTSMTGDINANADMQIVADKIDGGIFIYRTKDQTQFTGNAQTIHNLDEDPQYYRMQYTELEKFREMVNEFNSSDNKDIGKMEGCFAVDENGKLLIAQVDGQITTKQTDDGPIEETENTYKATIKTIDYEQKTNQYALPYEFLVKLCMVTENPEFVYHVAQMSLNTKIDMLVIDNKTTQVNKKVSTHTRHKDDGTTHTYTVTTIKTKTSTNPQLELKRVNTWSNYKKIVWTNTINETVSESTGENFVRTITTVKNNYSSIEGSLIRKSDNFLGLLRNKSGEYIEGTTPKFEVEGCKFDRYGINVRYPIPSRSIDEDPLSRLISGEQMFYEILKDNERTEPLVELMQYYMSFPEQEYYELDEDEIESVLGGFNDASLKTKYDEVTDSELEILYKICEAEAGGSSGDEIGHVASVILNRVKCSKWPNTIKEVVFQKNQFQPTRNGAYEKANPSDKTKNAVDKVVSGGDTTGGAVYFRTEASAKKAGMPTSSKDKHPSYIYLFTDPNTHVFLTDKKSLEELQASKTEELDGTSANIIEAAEKVHKYVRQNNYTYAQAGICLPNYKTRTIDCSSYVTWVLLEAGYRSSNFKEGMYQWSSVTFRSNKDGWEVIKDISDAKAGDILCYDGHVEIYAGSMARADKPLVYNCGGNASIKAAETSASGHKVGSILKILRVSM